MRGAMAEQGRLCVPPLFVVPVLKWWEAALAALEVLLTAEIERRSEFMRQQGGQR